MPTASQTRAKSLLGVRVNTEERKLIAAAARRENRSVNSFAREAVLAAASRPARRTPEQIRQSLAAFRAQVQGANPEGRDLLQELLDERRNEADD